MIIRYTLSDVVIADGMWRHVPRFSLQGSVSVDDSHFKTRKVARNIEPYFDHSIPVAHVPVMSMHLRTRAELLHTIVNAPFILAAPRSLPTVQRRLRIQCRCNSTHARSDKPKGASTFSFGGDPEIDAQIAKEARAEVNALLDKKLRQRREREEQAIEDKKELQEWKASIRRSSRSGTQIQESVDVDYTGGPVAETEAETGVDEDTAGSPPKRGRPSKGAAMKKTKSLRAEDTDAKDGKRKPPRNKAKKAESEKSGKNALSTKSDSLHRPPPQEPIEREAWALHRAALKAKFPEGWNPRKKLSPDAMLGIKQMHTSDPIMYSVPVLADQFKSSPEAIRRILKSKWIETADAETLQQRRERWAKRHDTIWDEQAELGLRPKRRNDMRVRDASEGAQEFEEELWREKVLREARSA